jgi:hypothetical protein
MTAGIVCPSRDLPGCSTSGADPLIDLVTRYRPGSASCRSNRTGPCTNGWQPGHIAAPLPHNGQAIASGHPAKITKRFMVAGTGSHSLL